MRKIYIPYSLSSMVYLYLRIPNELNFGDFTNDKINLRKYLFCTNIRDYKMI